MAAAVLDVVSEDGEEEHVAEEVGPAAVEEYACDECVVSVAREDAGWDESVVDEGVCEVGLSS